MKVIQETPDLLGRIAVDRMGEDEYTLWARGEAPGRMRACPEGIRRREKPPSQFCGTRSQCGRNSRITQIARTARAARSHNADSELWNLVLTDMESSCVYAGEMGCGRPGNWRPGQGSWLRDRSTQQPVMGACR